MAALLPLSDSERCGASLITRHSQAHHNLPSHYLCYFLFYTICSSQWTAPPNVFSLPIAVPFYNTSGFLSLECPSPWWLKFYLTSVQMLLFIWSLPQATQLEINVSLLLSSALFRLHFWSLYQGTLDSYLCLWYTHTYPLQRYIPCSQRPRLTGIYICLAQCLA